MSGASPDSTSSSNARKAADLHRAIGRQLPQRPAVPAAAELKANLPGADVAGVFPLAHELIDLLYVAYGALLALGVDPDLAFAEIHRVNMHKVTWPRRADGKQLKPQRWRAADLRGVFET